ncbi:hypothetical protein D0Y65_015916 [Glycine soja]|uniref:TIR domain-containing protein n=1 Tax=Glycine soja TaxID=3848 RepID=A0A445KEU3_GLYSO|nr:hypothetical protein D0Y65_015916 [Glycine soja]
MFKAAKNVEAIVLKENSYFLPTMTMMVDALSTMSSLKLLKFQYWNVGFEINFSGTLAKLSNELGYLVWEKYPFECLPPSFEPDKLVELILPHSNIKQLWEGTKPLRNLRRLDLSGSKNLIKMPYIGDALYLEGLDLKGCIQLEDIGLSIVLSQKLTYLNLRNCKSLIKLPRFGEDLILKNLDLEGCQKLRHIDPSIGLLKKLGRLNLTNCKNLVSFPNSILRLNSLECLDLSGCSKLYNSQLLYELRDAEQLKKIDIDGAPIHFQSTSSYSRVRKKSVSWLMPSSPIFPWMRQLDLSFCNLVEIPDAIGIICFLERLDLSGNNFATLPNLKKLSKLVCLKLQHCKRLKYLPDLPSRTDQPWEKWSSVEEDEYGLGLNIFNCPELVERDCCTNNCFSWMMQIVQLFTAISFLHHPSGHLKPQWVPFISSIIPGSEMPRWFDEQHLGMGNVINIDRSHFMQLDDNWIGIACCVIFVVHKERRMPPPDMEQRKKERPSLYIPVLFREDLVTDESDHLWLFYYPRSHFDVSNFDELKVESRFRDLYGQDLDVEVKKYAYRWVYKHDLEPSLRTGIRKRKRGTDYEDVIKDVPSSSSFTNDVFLSFRGEDTRYSFTGNLCRALHDSEIHTFVDDEELQRGDEIMSELEKKIENSRFFIIVLSQNYASSSFCLNVLAYILECVKRKRLLVLPIFYKVDPSNIRYHRGSFGEALANHETKFKAKMDGLEHNMEKLEKWKMALHETANISGYHFKQGDGYEYEFITRIVELVSSKIKQDAFHVGDYPVGLESYSEAFNYDVFLSFRGSDTLHGFTGYLYKALHDIGIHTFIDEDLKRGEEITQEIVQAIEESRIAIIVLSINYASSSFCLDELATILDCLKRKRLLVLPVFYNVDHSQVRLQEGSYGEALVKHEESLKHSMEKLEKWKMALHQVANLSDFKIKHGARYEYDFIGEIVEWVSSKINPAHYPVGLRSKVLEVRKLLDVGRDDGVYRLGIHGIDGVGKSTLAREVYNKISDHFDASCFIENVREKSKKHGLRHLQNIILSKILGEKDITSAQQVSSKVQRHRLQQKKVLMVLDDVDKPEKLQEVTGKLAWFGPGSKVIITTQDKQLLTSYDVNRTYEVKKLNTDDALQLLKWKAFKMHYFDPRYEKLLNRAVTYASSLPLTLEILASNLFGKSVKEWKSTLEEFERSLKRPIKMILKVIFDSLKEKEKNVLLDIACCFKGYELTEVQNILHAHYGHCMKYYIDVLVDKSLVYISHGTEPCNDTITMHDMIAEEIVQQESMTKPGERRRLWSLEDVREVLGYNTATSKIEIICLDYPIFDEEEIVQWDGTAFQNMQNLKTLIIKNGNFSKGPEYLPNSLRVFEWWGYPSHCLPSDFHPKELAICKLPCSRISTTELTNLLTKFVNVKRLKFSSEKDLHEAGNTIIFQE